MIDAPQPATLFQKIWRRHVVVDQGDGNTLLFVDRQLLHDGSFNAFSRLRDAGLKVAYPERHLATADHYVPTGDRTPGAITNPDLIRVLAAFETNTGQHDVPAFPLGDPRQGIVHVVGPEQGFTLPGTIMVCGDSHTSTHGALGALAFGIGASEVGHVLATQTLWQVQPRTMRIWVDDGLRSGVTAKDLALAIIAKIGTGAGSGHVIEYAGPAIRALSIEQRLTLCNMAIECGARAGMVAPDDTTFAYLKGRPYAPAGAAFDRAVAFWRTLPTDEGAEFDREIRIDGSEVTPMVTWGTSPQMATGIDGTVPLLDEVAEASRGDLSDALAYMGLTPGTAIRDIEIDQVFIGSCTNSRIEDLRAAASIARGGHAVVPVMVSPGSSLVKHQAEQEGLDHVFRAAGFTWVEAGCSACVGMNGDTVAQGQRCASTSNRNFRGRQGPGSRTHLVSPAMAAAAALAGRFVDVRNMPVEG